MEGASILLTGANKREIMAIGTEGWPVTRGEDLIRQLEEWLTRLPFPLKDCQSIHWILALPKFTLIPESLFVADKAGVYLTQTCQLLEDDMIYMDNWKKNSLNCVYAVPAELDEWITSNYPESIFSHSCQSLFKSISFLPSHKEVALIHIHPVTAELLLCKHSEVVLYNQFDYKTAEDLVYYLLFALENSNMLAPETQLYLSGDSSLKSSLIRILNKYIGSAKEVDKPREFTLSKPLSLIDLQKVFPLTGEL